jgi:hypothetical protein
LTKIFTFCHNIAKEVVFIRGMMMKKYIKSRGLSFLVIFLCASSIIKAHQINLSFDSLFPMTWYQKGLESSLYAWQLLVEACGNNEVALPFDVLISRLALAQFSINRMLQEKVACAPEDITYLVAVLSKVQSLVATIVVTHQTQDFVDCATDMIGSMQQQLSN